MVSRGTSGVSKATVVVTPDTASSAPLLGHEPVILVGNTSTPDVTVTGAAMIPGMIVMIL